MINTRISLVHATVKMLAHTAAIRRLDWAGATSKVAHPHAWHVGAAYW